MSRRVLPDRSPPLNSFCVFAPKEEIFLCFRFGLAGHPIRLSGRFSIQWKDEEGSGVVHRIYAELIERGKLREKPGACAQSPATAGAPGHRRARLEHRYAHADEISVRTFTSDWLSQSLSGGK